MTQHGWAAVSPCRSAFRLLMRVSVSMPIPQDCAAFAAARSNTDLICEACLSQFCAVVVGPERPGASRGLLTAEAPDAVFFDSSDTSESLKDGMGAVGGLICEPRRSGCTAEGPGTGAEGRDEWGAGANRLVLGAWGFVVLPFRAGCPKSLRVVEGFTGESDLFWAGMSSSVEVSSPPFLVERCRMPLYGAGVNSHLPLAPSL